MSQTLMTSNAYAGKISKLVSSSQYAEQVSQVMPATKYVERLSVCEQSGFSKCEEGGVWTRS